MYKTLCWSDSAVAGTGFGIVSKHVLTALHNSGQHDIHHLAINFHGNFADKTKVPWQQQPARLLDPRDPHGMKMFLKTIAEGDYDFIWVCNDLFVTQQVAAEYENLKSQMKEHGKKIPVLLYYYPVDCHVQADSCDFLKSADMAVCYTDHGRAETLKTLPSIEHKLRQVSHGIDTEVYHPLDPQTQGLIKKSVLRVAPDTTVVININRNNTRKQIPYSMLAFREFKKQVPNSIMYLHTAVQDQGGNLIKAITDLGMDPHKDIIFPMKYSSARPVPELVMNQLYNMADMYLTTHLGEGFGLTIVEAMAAGTPVIVPNNTCMPEHIGSRKDRGYMYPCNDNLWIDASGFRPKGLIPDIVDKMMEVYSDGSKWNSEKITAARKWTETIQWHDVANKWVDLFEEARELADQQTDIVEEV